MVGASFRGMPASCSDISATTAADHATALVTHLQLGERETTTRTHATVVLEGRAMDNWPQLVDWARSDFGDLRNASIATALLAASL